jgi:signal transduction histidine kinase
MHLPFGASDLAIQTVDSWRNGRANTLHWTRQDFLNWGRTMVEQGQIPDLETYQGAEDAPESLHLHFIPFNQGMLYVGATEPLSDGETSLATSLAEAFSIAYARYEDFVKLEKAKAGIEEALAELKATQSQLVQQEKLASLGQLTAGIAHEIKNPLNFVNNFSDVSLEMIDEALEELGKTSQDDHTAETAAILTDIKSNLAKIHEHGSRADGIVKSMLMHSRGGVGKMEPTPLNQIIKEYVNLAFHGMRAGKEPIDVGIDLQLDDSVGDVPLVAEDFSRVILNLCNNAFDACAERSRSAMRDKLTEDGRAETGYMPKLTIRTKSETGKIQIEIEDNGPGIPDDIKDKILQPFFTTKKGTQGTGLGLSITNDIIKAHGGQIAIKSKKHEGTTFTIELHV